MHDAFVAFGAGEQVVAMSIEDLVVGTKGADGAWFPWEGCEGQVQFALEQDLENVIGQPVVFHLAMMECEWDGGERGHDGGEESSCVRVRFRIRQDCQLGGHVIRVEFGRQAIDGAGDELRDSGEGVLLLGDAVVAMDEHGGMGSKQGEGSFGGRFPGQKGASMRRIHGQSFGFAANETAAGGTLDGTQEGQEHQRDGCH